VRAIAVLETTGLADVLARMVFDAVDGRSTIEEVSNSCGIDIQLTKQIVSSLVSKGFLEIRGAGVKTRSGFKIQRSADEVVKEREVVKKKRSTLSGLGGRAQPSETGEKTGLSSADSEAVRRRWREQRARRGIRTLTETLRPSFVTAEQKMAEREAESAAKEKENNSPEEDFWSTCEGTDKSPGSRKSQGAPRATAEQPRKKDS
jgi:predicted transcriptional regulator